VGLGQDGHVVVPIESVHVLNDDIDVLIDDIDALIDDIDVLIDDMVVACFAETWRM